MTIHIGKIIKKQAQLKKIGPTKLAKQINTTRENIYSIYKRASVPTDQLFALSVAIEHDFFRYYSEREPLKSFEKNEINALKEEFESVKKLVREKEKLIKNLKSLNRIQNERIKVLLKK